MDHYESDRSTGEPLRSNRSSSASGLKFKASSYSEKYRQRKHQLKKSGIHGLSKINISIGFEPIHFKGKKKNPQKREERTIKRFAKSIINIIEEKGKEERKTSNHIIQVTLDSDESTIDNMRIEKAKQNPLVRQQVNAISQTINSFKNNLETMMDEKEVDEFGRPEENDYLKYAARECVFHHLNKKFMRGCLYLESRVRKILFPPGGEAQIEELKRVVFQSIRFSRKLTRCFQALTEYLNKFNDLDWDKLKERKLVEDLKVEEQLEGVFIPDEGSEAKSKVLAFELQKQDPTDEVSSIVNNSYEERSLKIEGMGEVKGTFIPKIPPLVVDNEKERPERPERRLKKSKFFDPVELLVLKNCEEICESEEDKNPTTKIKENEVEDNEKKKTDNSIAKKFEREIEKLMKDGHKSNLEAGESYFNFKLGLIKIEEIEITEDVKSGKKTTQETEELTIK